MKKKIILGMMLLLSTMGAMAQGAESSVGRFSVIPRIGVAIANWTDNALFAVGVQDEMKSKSQAGFLGGVDVEYRATEHFGISLGAYYARQGFRFADFEAEDDASKGQYTGYKNMHANLNYVNVPLMLKAYVTPSFAVMAGAQVGFLCGNSKLFWEQTDLEKDKDGSTKYKDTRDLKSSISGKKNTDISIPVGLSYEYMNVVLDARYNIGLTKTMDGSDSKNKVFTFTVGYRFTL